MTVEMISFSSAKSPRWKVFLDAGKFVVKQEGNYLFRMWTDSNERMRISSDGTTRIGNAAGYQFETREWADLCAERLQSLDGAIAPILERLQLALEN